MPEKSNRGFAIYSLIGDNIVLAKSGFEPDFAAWLRCRLRYCIWHHWKKPNKKMRSLIRLGKSTGEPVRFVV